MRAPTFAATIALQNIMLLALAGASMTCVAPNDAMKHVHVHAASARLHVDNHFEFVCLRAAACACSHVILSRTRKACFVSHHCIALQG